jgi:ABC-type branched-subunit amino acid transport system substrate-binding protein
MAAQPAQSAPLRIGVLLPPEEEQSASIREGALLAQDQASKTYQTNIQIIIRGRAGQWGADADEAARMVTDDGVAGLVAPPNGAASHLVLQVSGRTAVPVVTLCGDSLLTRTGVPWMLRVAPRTGEEAQALFLGISNSASHKPQRWAAIVPEGRAGREIAHDLRQAASDSHCEFAGIVEVPRSCISYEKTRTETLNCHPEGILIWLAPIPAGRLVSEFRNAGFTGALAGPGWLESASFISSAQEALEGFVIPRSAKSEASDTLCSSFEAAYRGRWGHAPDAMAAISYDAVMVLVHLIQSTSQALNHRFPPDFSEPGVTGELRFDAEGNRKLKLELLKGQRGALIRMQ